MERFRKIGLKLTPQRLAIFEFLEGNAEHPSAEDIFKAVSKRFPTMSFATVYNTLEALAVKGEVVKLTFDPERMRYDPNTLSHHHLICMSCGKVMDVHGEYTLELSQEQAGDFDILGKHIEFRGLCPKCKGKGR